MHLYNVYGVLPDVQHSPVAGGNNNYNANNAYAAPVANHASSSTMAGGGLSDLHKTVLQSIKSVKGGEGVALVSIVFCFILLRLLTLVFSKDDVMRTLRNVPQNQVREAIEYLSAEGHIYSTIDENHFRASN